MIKAAASSTPRAGAPKIAGMEGLLDAPREVTLPTGQEVPALGLGTWRLGERADFFDAAVKSLRLALEMGYRVIDTAEMYGEGGAERVLGAALAQALRAGLQREQLFIVSKFTPSHASAQAMLRACEASLRRLRLDQIDLYLLHWRGDVPLAETVRGFEILQRRGLIRHWGVSNFDTADMHELGGVTGGLACAVDQVWFSLSQRGPGFDLLPWLRLHQMPLMAYCPLDQGALARHPALHELATNYGATPAQVALAWVMAQAGVLAVAKAIDPEHLRQNWRAAHMQLDSADLSRLDQLFPAPTRKRALAMT